MSKLISCLLAVVFVGLALGSEPEKNLQIKKDLEKLKGEWFIVYIEKEGELRQAPSLGIQQDEKIIFKTDGKPYFMSFPNVPISEIPFTIDPSKKPKTFDIPMRDGMSLGLYQIEGQRLKVYIDYTGRELRPKELKTKPGSAGMLFVLDQNKGLGLPGQPRGEAAQKALAKLQGNWKVQRFQKEDEIQAQDKTGPTTLVIKNDQMTFQKSPHKGGEQFTLIVDPTQTPPAIDLRPKGDDHILIRGIFEVKNDSLQICFAFHQATGDRPKEFVAKKASGNGLFVLQRKGK